MRLNRGLLGTAVFVAAFAFCLGGCSPLTGSNDTGSSGFAANVVTVGSDIVSATTWSSSHVYYIPASTTIYVSAALTVQQGTVVKFGSGAGLNIESTGQLNAVGSSSSHIVFTSIKDDTAGGDSNLDGAATSPARGDYGDTYVSANSSNIQYCEFRYGQNGLVVNGAASATVSNCSFAYNGASATSGYGLDVANAGSNLTMSSNTFYGNIHPLAIKFNQAIDTTSVFHSGATTNTYNGIWVMGDLTAATTQSNTEVAYVFGDPATYYLNSYALTIADGVCLKFITGSGLNVDNGSLSTSGTVYFTSLKDDRSLCKGDTNGDGSASTPSGSPDAPSASGDWNGVQYSDSSYLSSSANVHVDYATSGL